MIYDQRRTIHLRNVSFKAFYWYRLEPESYEPRLGWYGVGLKAAHDVFTLIGRDPLSTASVPKMPAVVTNFGNDIVGAVASGELDMAPIEMGFNSDRFSRVDFGPSLAFSRYSQ